MKVTITLDEMAREPKPWPCATFANTMAVLMARKGLRMRPSVAPKPEDLLPPWRIDEDRSTLAVSIWQGDTQPPETGKEE